MAVQITERGKLSRVERNVGEKGWVKEERVEKEGSMGVEKERALNFKSPQKKSTLTI